VGKGETVYTVGGKVNWCSHYGEEYGGSLKKLKTGTSQVALVVKNPLGNAGDAKKKQQSYHMIDPVIPLLGICPEKTMI